jgi:hypothetical protein
MPDFTEDILAHLRRNRGRLVWVMDMVGELTACVKDRTQNRKVRGRVLSDLNRLTREKKVIRYRKTTMVRRHPRSSQGLVRISELFV